LAGIDVPAILGNYICGEEVDLLEGVALLFGGVGLELAEVPGAGDLTRSVAVALSGQALHTEDATAGCDSDVEGGGFSPGLGDFVAVERGFGHEEEFGPLAALFESLENFEFAHWWLR